jgi:hypothetical protein
MIREHTFNTAWFGAPVGIADESLFALAPAERRAQLDRFAWVELGCDDPSTVLRKQLGENGFRFVDLQINFRIGLRAAARASADAVEIAFAGDAPFDVTLGEMPAFPTERFRHVPGVDEARLTERYRRWANALVEEAPAHCMRVLHGGAVQGWFFSRVAKPGLQLALAFRHREATISGHTMYEAAMSAYAARGERLGWASFSASNTAVHNIYAHLGARFFAPTERYLWLREV